MSQRFKMVFLSSIAFLLILNVYIFNFSQYGYNLKPTPAKAAVSATYAETWNATEVAMTYCYDGGGWWASSLLSYYYLTTATSGTGWPSGRSGSVNGGSYWWWRWWWGWCCWWRWWGTSNSDNASAHLDAHAFVTGWTVDGTLSK